MSKRYLRSMLWLGVGVFSLGTLSAMAETTQNLGTVAQSITGSLASILSLIKIVGYLSGFGLVVASLFKFKQHKDNPQQVQLGTCITMLLVGVALIFLPSLITTSGSTIFGSSAKVEDISSFGASAISTTGS